MLAWTVHPAARRKPAATAVLGVVALAALAATEVGRGASWGVVAAAFLTLCVSSFLFPTRYVLDQRGIEVRHLGGVRRRSWRDVRRVERVSGGILLSPYLQPTLRDRLRAILLRVDGDPGRILEFVESHRGP